MNFKFSILILFHICLFVNKGLGKKKELKCNLINDKKKLLTTEDWEHGIQLENKINDTTKFGQKILYYEAVNTTHVNGESVNGVSNSYYVSSDIDASSHLWIQIDEAFEQYEDYEVETEMKIELRLICNDHSVQKISFTQPIIDTNNHDPKFSKKSYTAKVPMPLPQGYTFDFPDEIVARDVDLTNEKITFSLNPKEEAAVAFEILYIGKDHKDKKNHRARLVTKSPIDIKDNITFTIFAEDGGKLPYRNTSATVTIIADKENSLPRFSQPLYTANVSSSDYTNDETKPLVFSEGNIAIAPNEYSLEVAITETIEVNSSNFKLTYSPSNEEGLIVYVRLINLKESFWSQRVHTAVLTATKGTIKTSTVLEFFVTDSDDINLPENVPESGESSPGNVNKDGGVNGYMISTIVLSLISVGLIAFIVYMFLIRK